MLFYTVHLEGSEDDISSMIDILAEYDENFSDVEIDTDYDFTEEGNPDISNIEEVDEMAQALTSAIPNARFNFSGTLENHDYNMDFEIDYDSKVLIRRNSEWYVSYGIDKFCFPNYEEFCDCTGLGDKISREQFEKWLDNESFIAVLDDGKRTVYEKAPLSNTVTLKTEQLGVCPVCGERLNRVTPVMLGQGGKRYHIWCAEKAGIEGEIE